MTRTILPPLRRSAADAEAFARVVHAGQVDKAGRPYVEHLERVAERAMRIRFSEPFLGSGRMSRDDDDELLQIAWLHDVIEDEKASHRDLIGEGFSNSVVIAVDVWLSKDPRKPYGEHVTDICARAPLPVLIVKLADMEDNADPERLALLPEDVRARLERKYGPALEMLRAAVERGAGRDA